MKKSASGNFKAGLGLFAAGLLLFGLAVLNLSGLHAESSREKGAYKAIEEKAVFLPDEPGRKTGKDTKREAEESGGEAFDYREADIDFEMLLQMNEDVVGWILFDRNEISYPVLKGKDNEEYLNRLADGTIHSAGSIFMDSACSSDFTDSHTILYGHNRKDLGMFGKLKFYRTQEDYYEKNRYFTIYTPEHIFRYEIFSWYEAEPDDEVYQAGFEEGEAFGAFAGRMAERGGRDTGNAAGAYDRVVTLSTCSADGLRFLVHGKRIYAAENKK